MPDNLYLKERLRCLQKAVSRHFIAIAGLILLGGIALLFAYLAIHFEIYAFLSFQLIWILLFYFAYTIFDSIGYDFEKNLIRKYGKCLTARVTSSRKEGNDLSTEISPGRHVKSGKEVLYFMEYENTYGGEVYRNCLIHESEEIHRRMEAGSPLPIKILKIRPSASDVRLRKLRKDLQPQSE